MASNFQHSVYDGGGYDVEVIENYPEDFNCGICTLLIKDATHGCDNHVFCKSCLQENIDHGVRDEGNVICPGGCREVIDPSNLQPSKLINRMVNKLSTKCDTGFCPWKGDLLDFVQDHQKVCEYSLIPCTNDGCEITVMKRDIRQHEKDCLHQMIECDYCRGHVKKMNKKTHESVCSNETVDCLYQDIGCYDKVSRRDVALHKSTHNVKHTELMYRSFKQQQSKSIEEISLLKKENSEMKAHFVKKIQTLSTTLQKKTIEINQLKDQVKNNWKEIQPLRDSSIMLRKKENAKLQEEKLKADIKSLKDKIQINPTLQGVVELLNNDSILQVNVGCNHSLSIEELSKCYEKNNFNYVIEKLGLKNENKLMADLFHHGKFHYYDMGYSVYYMENDLIATFEGWFCFPVESNEINLDIQMPTLKIKFSKNVGLVDECIGNECEKSNFDLYLGKYKITMGKGVKVNINNAPKKLMDFSFGDKYACLHYMFESFR